MDLDLSKPHHVKDTDLGIPAQRKTDERVCGPFDESLGALTANYGMAGFYLLKNRIFVMRI